MVKVKICGITRLADAKAALASGADALGFVFAKSPRRVSVVQARRISRAVGPWATKVGVFVRSSPRTIARVMASCGLDVAQLHGDESASTASALRGMGYPVIKAVRVGSRAPKRLDRYPADALLFDTAARNVYGGTGRSFDWSLLNGYRTEKPVFISGGLHPGNVRLLLKKFRPYGVDVSSGVEKTPGKKDHQLVREFIKNVKTYR